MKIIAHRGTTVHAPENSRIALISAYVAGADVLEFALQLSRDGQLVVCHDLSVERLTGRPGRVSELSLSELRALDFSATFAPANVPGFRYRHRPGHRLRIETLPELFDELPAQAELLIQLVHDPQSASERRDTLCESLVAVLRQRGISDRIVVYSTDTEVAAKVHSIAPELRCLAFTADRSPTEPLAHLETMPADGVYAPLTQVLTAQRTLTAFGEQLRMHCLHHRPRLGVWLYDTDQNGLLDGEVLTTLSGFDFVQAVGVSSLLALSGRRGEYQWLRENFAGRDVDTERIALGYAKANKYAHVFQHDGVHIDIKPYEGGLGAAPSSALEGKVRELEERSWYALGDWPFYSGGGLGVVTGIDDDFCAVVTCEAAQVAQATTLEMAVVNVEPARHRPPWKADHTPNLPTSFRDRNNFFDPHGAPPFVGVEHDEDDGFRINHNAGTTADNNQYGFPVGDGQRRQADLRLERRGSHFAAYYRHDSSMEWVCVGAIRNESMNQRVFLRCVGKRWRQEDPQQPDKWLPIIANNIVFRDLVIHKFAR